MPKITKGRLTNAIISSIQWAVKTELGKLLEPIEAREHDLAIEILKDEAGDHWDRILEIPGNFINKTSAIHISINQDERKEIMEAAGIEHIGYNQTLSLNDYYPGEGYTSRSLSLLTKEQKPVFKQLIIDRELVIKEINAAESELRAVLSSVKTVPKLIELWPDVMDYMPEEPEVIKALPAVKTTALDSLLPVDKKAA